MCGLTNGNYPQLQELHNKYNEQGLSVVAFPCNQFGGQEPGTEAEIKDFVKKFDVQFDMMGKINVNGENAHPLYKYLKHKQGGLLGDFIKWNFSKFLVDRNGIPVNRYAPTTSPKDIEKDIVALLNAKASL
jgi:glutathione peroxidase-family protein